MTLSFTTSRRFIPTRSTHECVRHVSGTNGICHTGNLRVLLYSSRGVGTGRSRKPWRSWSTGLREKPSSPWTGSWMEPPPVPDGSIMKGWMNGWRRWLPMRSAMAAWFIPVAGVGPDGPSRSHFDLSGSPPVEDRQSGQESFGAPGPCHPRAHRLAVLARRIVRSLGTGAGRVGQGRSLYGEESGGGGAGEQSGRLAVVERVRHGRRTGQEACPT